MRPLVKTLLFIFILVKAHCLETENWFVNRKLTMLRFKIGRDESRLEGWEISERNGSNRRETQKR